VQHLQRRRKRPRRQRDARDLLRAQYAPVERQEEHRGVDLERALEALEVVHDARLRPQPAPGRVQVPHQGVPLGHDGIGAVVPGLEQLDDEGLLLGVRGGAF